MLRSDYLQAGHADVLSVRRRTCCRSGRRSRTADGRLRSFRRGLSGQTDDRAARLVEPLVETTAWRVQGATVERRVAPPLLDVFAGPFGM